jgi:predicted NBD/HSP70 family sugar kinase
MREYGEILATACVGAVNLFEPDYIVLGGKLKEAENTLRDAIEQAVDQRSLSRGTRKVKVISSSQKEDSRAISAAQIVIEKYLMGE